MSSEPERWLIEVKPGQFLTATDHDLLFACWEVQMREGYSEETINAALSRLEAEGKLRPNPDFVSKEKP
jgi:hypothetical protein